MIPDNVRPQFIDLFDVGSSLMSSKLDLVVFHDCRYLDRLFFGWLARFTNLLEQVRLP